MKPKLAAATVLSVVAVAAGAAAAPALTQAQAQPHAQAPATPIKHVVVLYLENHSFDSLLGFWCRRHQGRCPNGGMPASVTLSGGAVVKPRVLPDVPPGVKHNVISQEIAINGGLMNGWGLVPECHAKNGYQCIGGYTPAQVPNLATLADDFAISDHMFSMQDSPSWGGHLYAVMPTLDGFRGDTPKAAPHVAPGPGWGCNSKRITQWQSSPKAANQWVPSCVPDPSLAEPNGGAFEPTPVSYAPTIMDRLNAAGLSWRIYGEPTAKGMESDGYIWDVCPSIAECLDTPKQEANNVPSDTFISDVQAGHLPDFALVVPGGPDAKYSEHNGYSTTAGDDWIGQIASAIMQGPLWRSTVMFITWDDCGCFYDQVPPGINPDGTQQGPRVPLVIVSPYARPGYTDTTATTYAGILAYVEQNFGLKPLGVNDAQAYPFTNALNYSQTPLRPVKMVNRPVPPGDHIDWAAGRQDT